MSAKEGRKKKTGGEKPNVGKPVQNSPGGVKRAKRMRQNPSAHTTNGGTNPRQFNPEKKCPEKVRGKFGPKGVKKKEGKRGVSYPKGFNNLTTPC